MLGSTLCSSHLSRVKVSSYFAYVDVDEMAIGFLGGLILVPESHLSSPMCCVHVKRFLKRPCLGWHATVMPGVAVCT